jgi:hypothetical protein
MSSLSMFQVGQDLLVLKDGKARGLDVAITSQLSNDPHFSRLPLAVSHRPELLVRTSCLALILASVGCKASGPS